jgi:hypothetical protein
MRSEDRPVPFNGDGGLIGKMRRTQWCSAGRRIVSRAEDRRSGVGVRWK